jgi:hypothetical protein
MGRGITHLILFSKPGYNAAKQQRPDLEETDHVAPQHGHAYYVAPQQGDTSFL